MGKFIKYVTIIGCILILVGAGMTTAAFSLGGNPFRAVEEVGVRFYEHGRELDDTFQELGEHIAANTASGDLVRPTASVVDEDSNYFEEQYPEVTHLKIEIKGGEVEVVSDPENNQLMIFCENGDPENLAFKNMDRYKKLELAVETDEEYLIHVPAEWRLDELEIECKGGVFRGENIRVNDMEIAVGGGEVDIYQIGGESTSIECAGGVVNWTGEGELSRKIDVECAGGKVILSLDPGVEPEKVGFDIEYAAGAIDFYGEEFSGVGAQRRNAKDGMPHLELDVAGGMVVVE